jgi:predicted RNase H-like HicB family nuclease
MTIKKEKVAPVLKSPTYSVRVFWSAEDGGYIALCPELKNVSAFGESHAAAVEELDVAIAAAIAVYEEEGWPLPKPAVEAEYSGQLRLRMPRSLHAQLAVDADREGVSLNSLIVSRLSAFTGGYATGLEVVRPLRPELKKRSG